MKSEELLYSLDHVGEDLLAAADQTILVRKHQPWGRIAVAAVLVTALGFGSFRLLAHKMASTTPAAELNPSASTLTPVSNATEPVAQDPAQLVGVMLSESGSYNDGESYSYRLPRINADTPGAKAINEAIDQKWGETIRDGLNHNQGNDRRIDFTQTVWGDILSVIIYGETVYDFTDYEAYLYEISTGRWLNSLELLDRLGVSKDTFLKACQVEFQQREQNKGVTSSFFEAAPVEQNGTFYRLYDESEERDVPFEVYPDENGQLVVIAPITCIAGPAYQDEVFPLDLTRVGTSDSSEDLHSNDSQEDLTRQDGEPEEAETKNSEPENQDPATFEPVNLRTTVAPAGLLGLSLSESGSYDDSVSEPCAYSYQLPCINADTAGAKAINEAILQRFSSRVQEQKELMEQGCSLTCDTIEYYGKVYGDILSLVVDEISWFGMTNHEVYCYEISTGRWLQSTELLERIGVSEQTFFDACRGEFQQRDVLSIDNVTSLTFQLNDVLRKDGAYYRNVQIVGVDHINDATVTDKPERLIPIMVYPDENGKVTVITETFTPAGAGWYEYIIPLDLYAEGATNE